MKRLIKTTTLLLALSLSVAAGQIPTDGTPAPVAPPQGIASTNSTGQIPSVGMVQELSEAALSAVVAVLSLVS